MSGESAEQQARDLLERCGVEDAQSFSAGDVVELANLIAEVHRLRTHVDAVPSAIRAYAGSELDGYSYHGDGSAIEALKHLQKNAEGINVYAGPARKVTK